ncbi:MAG TPA: hypothetical protein VHY08_00190 [Bacillota bacterium]|nr:hypothetical protein [Bacillota bacterium]
MVKKLTSIFPILILLIFLTTGCGSINSPGFRGGACYWKNQTRFNLQTRPAQSQSSSLNVLNPKTIDLMSNVLEEFNGDIYIAGSINGIAWYEKNGQVFILDGTKANDIYVSGEDIYVAGRCQQGSAYYACYWKNGERFMLDYGAYTYKIFVKDSVVYVAGEYNDNGILACYWVNGEKVNLNGHGAFGIFVDGTDVYVSGDYFVRDDPYEFHACYWKNGVRFDLDNMTTGEIFVKDSQAYTSGWGKTNDKASAIVVEGTDVYTAGAFDREISPKLNTTTPCYWKNGQLFRVSIPSSTDPAESGEIYDISVSGSDVFLVGQWWNNRMYSEGLWFNGNFIPTYGLPNAVFVVRH